MDNNTEETAESFVFTYEQRCVVALFFIVIAMLCIIGNSLVVLAVLISEKLWNATNAFVLNLAFADLVTGLTLPFNVMALLSMESYPAPSELCTLAAYTMFTSVGCSLYTLASIAFNRLVLITKPMRYPEIFTERNILVWIIFLWALPLVQTAIPSVLGAGEIGYNQKYGVCAQLDVSNAYDFAQSIGLFPISLLIILVCYIRIYFYLRKHNEGVIKRDSENKGVANRREEGYEKHRNVNVSHSNHSNDATVDDEHHQNIQQHAGSTHSNIQTNISKRQVEITKNLFYVVSAFVICVTPYAICLMVEESDPAMPYTASLMLFNSCINPVIYATKHPYFKQVFRCIVKCRWHEVPKPSKFLKWWTRKTWCMSCKNGNRLSI